MRSRVCFNMWKRILTQKVYVMDSLNCLQIPWMQNMSVITIIPILYERQSVTHVIIRSSVVVFRKSMHCSEILCQCNPMSALIRKSVGMIPAHAVAG